MKIALYLARKAQLYRNRKKLARLDSWIHDLEDQIHSGQVALYKALQEHDQLVAQGYLLEDHDDLIRRSGAGA